MEYVILCHTQARNTAHQVFGGYLLRKGLQLAQSIAYLHARSIAHRDIKLENVLLDEWCNVRLIDFGFAAEVSPGKEAMWDQLGTPSYMAPELWMHQPSYSFEVDIWAMAVMLHELLTRETIGDARAPALCSA